MTEKANEKKINVLSILEEAEKVPEKEREFVSSSASSRTTIFKSSKFKKGVRTETSLIDDCIVCAVKELYKEGKNSVSYYALTRLFEAMHYSLKKPDRIRDHIHAKDDVFPTFFEVGLREIVFKKAIINALGLDEIEVDQVEKAEIDQVQKPKTILRKKA